MTGPRELVGAHERHDRIERCWMCGIRLPVAQLVPDGGDACADIRWYCRDLRACTDRWTRAGTSRLTLGRAVGGTSSAGAA